VTLQGENVEALVRKPEVQAIVSQVSMIQPVRDKLIVEQKKLAADGSVVMDGRDMGTVVIPDAELKVFLVADPEVRAARRMLQYQER
jgi:cytidylate kinase